MRESCGEASGDSGPRAGPGPSPRPLEPQLDEGRCGGSPHFGLARLRAVARGVRARGRAWHETLFRGAGSAGRSRFTSDPLPAAFLGASRCPSAPGPDSGLKSRVPGATRSAARLVAEVSARGVAGPRTC